MDIRKWIALVLFSLMLALFLNVSTSDQNKFKYIGADKCRICHMTKSSGNQYGKWKNGMHAKAYDVLATPQAKKQAEDKGIDGDPQMAEQCLKCHTTAAGEETDMISSGFKKELGVQCESCHGPGSGYASPAVMSARKYMENREEARKKVFEMGLIKPDEELCLTCHKEPAFDFEEYKEIIAHPVPRTGRDQ